MHVTIYAVVPGETREEALEIAETVFGGLQERRAFDYYVICPPTDVHWITDITGWETLEAAMSAQDREFLRYLDKVKRILNTHTAEDILNSSSSCRDLDLQLFRHNCFNLGKYEGYPLIVYSEGGDAVRNCRELQELMAKEKQVLWLVSADTHF